MTHVWLSDAASSSNVLFVTGHGRPWLHQEVPTMPRKISAVKLGIVYRASYHDYVSEPTRVYGFVTSSWINELRLRRSSHGFFRHFFYWQRVPNNQRVNHEQACLAASADYMDPFSSYDSTGRSDCCWISNIRNLLISTDHFVSFTSFKGQCPCNENFGYDKLPNKIWWKEHRRRRESSAKQAGMALRAVAEAAVEVARRRCDAHISEATCSP